MKPRYIILLISLILVLSLFGVVQANESQVDNRDIDVFYFLDGDRDFLEMKMGPGNLVEEEDVTYYEYINTNYRMLYWVAEDDFTINKVSIIKSDNYHQDYLPIRFMGIGFDMTLEEAEENVTTTPQWHRQNDDVRVEFSVDENNMVNRIDIISNKVLKKTIKKEDFYLKYLGRSILKNWGYLSDISGNNSLRKDEKHREYIYKTVKGSDKWGKIYKYSADHQIISLMLVGMTGEYKATIPSLLNVQINMPIDKVEEVLATKATIISRNTNSHNYNDLVSHEYVVQIKESKLSYKVLINLTSTDKSVKSIEVSEYDEDSVNEKIEVKNISNDMMLEEIIAIIGEDYKSESGIDRATGVTYHKIIFPGLEIYRNQLFVKSIQLSDIRYGVFEDISVGNSAKEALEYCNSKYKRLSFIDEWQDRGFQLF